MDIKIYGPIRSGTNFLEFLIRNNLQIEPLVNQFAWKHSIVIDENLQALNTIVYKDVYAWIQSVFQYSKVTKFFKMPNNSLKNFIRSPFVFRERSAHLDAKNIVELYNKCYESWFNSKCQKVFINYEILLSSPKEQLTKLAKLTKNPINETIVFPAKNILPHECRNIKKMNEFNYNKQNYYTCKQYMQNFSAEDIDFVESNLNRKIIKSVLNKIL